ncbi:unnamed protein product [Lactuca virosa]|uniref:Uncharacterized protein n=1 Tax=Lactuca virosa TaxID=75947 RepID=A0AAU9PRP1_9ASTR|nr:unnamed protein product [Lactuca virosa]
MRRTRAQSLRRSARMMEEGFQSKFTNTANNVIDLEEEEVLYIESGSSSVCVVEGKNAMMNVGKKRVSGGGRKLELPKKTNNGKSYKNDTSDDDFVERKNMMDSGKNENKMKRKRVDKSDKYKKVKMAYADRVICEDVNLQRYRPFITEIDSEHLRVLEKYEVSRGVFGNLSLRENVDGVFYDEMMNQDHSKDRSVEESCGIIESMVGRLVEHKKVV